MVINRFGVTKQLMRWFKWSREHLKFPFVKNASVHAKFHATVSIIVLELNTLKVNRAHFAQISEWTVKVSGSWVSLKRNFYRSPLWVTSKVARAKGKAGKYFSQMKCFKIERHHHEWRKKMFPNQVYFSSSCSSCLSSSEAFNIALNFLLIPTEISS